VRHSLTLRTFAAALSIVTCSLAVTACDSAAGTGSGAGAGATLRISSIPDQDPQKLAARDGAMADYLAETLGVRVEHVPVTDYAASVALFRAGDLDLVFYGGLTGVQARLQVPDAVYIAQRDIDATFRSVFIANTASGIAPLTAVSDLTVFKGKRFTFGSESSTSGRLMPEYFLDQAGVAIADLAGPPGYSGSHDKTIDLVEAGTFEAGALNMQVWNTRTAAKSVDTTKVTLVFTTPPYHDYHWLGRPDLDTRFGDGFGSRISAAMLDLGEDDPDDAAILKLYGAKAFIATEAANYTQIEEIGRKNKLIT
jgi:phosphonate transport system substrate-binding protein